MKHLTTRQLVELSLYAALIFISVQFLRIPLGAQFVHFGNALVVVAVLLYGSRLGALVAAIGLGLFDVLNGYAAEVWITILESLIVCLVLHFVFEKFKCTLMIKRAQRYYCWDYCSDNKKLLVILSNTRYQ